MPKYQISTKLGVEPEFLRLNISSFDESRYFEPQYADKGELDSEKSINLNKMMLREIAQMSSKKEWAKLSEVRKNEEDKKIIDNLGLRDVVVVDEKNNRCKIKVALYKEWILQKYGSNL